MEEVRSAKAAIRLDIAKQEAMGIKVTRYDSELNCFYVINGDGKKQSHNKISEKKATVNMKPKQKKDLKTI